MLSKAYNLYKVANAAKTYAFIFMQNKHEKNMLEALKFMEY
jgi:hypothetical protein